MYRFRLHPNHFQIIQRHISSDNVIWDDVPLEVRTKENTKKTYGNLCLCRLFMFDKVDEIPVCAGNLEERFTENFFHPRRF